MNYRYKTILPLTLLLLPFSVSCNNKTGCARVKENYKEYVQKNTNLDQYKDKTIDEIKEELDTKKIGGIDTYYFKDIDYTNDYNRASWPAGGHLGRAIKIAILAENKNSSELRDIAKKLTLNWVYSNYHNINWWQNELGANSNLANLGLFTFDYLGKKGQDAFNGKIRESSLKYRPSVSTHTGANVIDYIDITCRNAAINNDKEEMDTAFNRLKEEITNEKVEGFQKDGSFFQHGRQVQNVSYGKAIIRIGKTLYNLRGTDYNLPEDKMTILSDYILKGLRDSTFKGYTNYTTVSREYSRVNNLDTQANGFKELSFFTELDYYPSDKKEETNNFISSLEKRENAVKKDTITYFPIAKMVVANIGHDDTHEGVYISYKSSEPNLTNTECVNGENRLGLNQTYGTNTCVMDEGTEYYNIAPVMNYNYMPGTTSVIYNKASSDNLTPSLSTQDAGILEAVKLYGDTELGNKLPKVDATNGYIYNDGQNDEVTYFMTKSKSNDRCDFTTTCFVTNDGMVLVGSNLKFSKIKSTCEEEFIESENLHTTVDQYVTNDEPASASESKSFKNHSNGNIIYRSLTPDQDLVKTVEKRVYTAEDWKRNNSSQSTTDAGEKNIATITIKGDNIDSYAYAIQPENVANEFKLASRSEGVHAIVLGNGKIAACFYDKDATFTYNSKEYKLEDKSKFETGKGAFVLFDK